MKDDTQLMKGILEGCLLHVIAKGETYGYKAVETLKDYGFDVNEATVYPILLRLQNKALLDVEKRPSPFGPDRKYYSLTGEGVKELGDFKESWERLGSIVNKVLEVDGDD